MLFTRILPVLFLVPFLTFLYSTTSTAQNIVINPGAELGDFTGWQRGGSPSGQPIINPSTHIPSPANHSGSFRFGISVGWSTADCYQYQTLNVTPSRRYAVSLWYTKQDGTDESIEVTWANGSFGAPESTLYTVGGSVVQNTWTELAGANFVPSQNTATLVIYYRHAFGSNIASIHVDDISVIDIGQGPTATPAPTFTPTRTGGPTSTPTPTILPGTTPLPLPNADFESGVDGNGVAVGWTSFRVSGGGIWKSNELLGRLGGGIYGCFGPSGVPGYTCIDEYESIRMSAKTYLVSLDRYNQVGHIEDVLGPEVITIAKFDAEAPDIYPDGDTWQNNAEADGARFADWYYTQWIVKNPSFEPDALYGLNEPSVNNAADIVKVARFELGFTRRCHQLGFKAIVMNNSVGTPGDINLYYLPEIVELLEEADYVGYHAYGDWNTGWMCPQSANPYTFRWQQIANYYISQGWRFPAVIYTEAGQYWWKGSKTSQQIRDDLVCYENRERNEEWWSLGIDYFVTGAWPGAWDEMHIGDGSQGLIIDACRATNRAHPLDAHAGVRSQEMAGSGEAFDIGILRQIPTQSGWLYEFRGWFKYEYDYGWPNQATIQVGWDPTGQTANPLAPTVQWTTDLIPLGQNNPIYNGPWESDLWYQYRKTFQAASSNASIWIRAAQPSAGINSRVYVDDVSIWPMGAGTEQAHFNVY